MPFQRELNDANLLSIKCVSCRKTIPQFISLKKFITSLRLRCDPNPLVFMDINRKLFVSMVTNEGVFSESWCYDCMCACSSCEDCVSTSLVGEGGHMAYHGFKE